MRKLNLKECSQISGQGLIEHCPFFYQSNPAAHDMAKEDFRSATFDVGVLMGAITGTVLSTSIVAAEGIALLGVGAIGAGVGMIATPLMIDYYLFGERL